MVDEQTIESEVGLGYSYNYDYDYGVEDELDAEVTGQSIVEASATGTAKGIGATLGTQTIQITASGTARVVDDASGISTVSLTATGDSTAIRQIPQQGWGVVLPNKEDDLANSEPRVESDLIDVNRTKALNRFAREAKIEIWDASKDKLKNYEDYEEVQIYYDGELDFGGFVVEQQWRDNQTDVYLLSHDFWLKKNTVVREFEDMAISDILETLIVEETPLIWNDELVEVGDDQAITQEYRGETVNEIIDDLSQASTQEQYGATNNREFFFERQERSSGPVDFERGRYLSTEWDDDSRREVNRITLYYSEGDESVTVEDKTKQKRLGEQIGSDDPVVESASVSRPEIDDERSAERKAQSLLSRQEPLELGDIETFSIQDVEPGDVVDVVDPSNDIDDEYVVFETTTEWAEGEVRVASNESGVLDILADLSEDVDRIDLKDADTDADDTEIINIEGCRAAIEVLGDIDGTEFDDSRLTNIARERLVNGWRGRDNFDITEIAVGSDNSNLSRTNEELEDEVERISAVESLPTDTSATYTADTSETDIAEVGLFNSEGEMLIRAIRETATDSPSVEIGFDIHDDPDFEDGVLTENGQTAIRNILANNDPSTPGLYAYGTDDTQPEETDTQLGNEVAEIDLDEILINTLQGSDWGDVADSDDELVFDNQIRTVQTAIFEEAENFDLDLFDIVSGDDYSGGSAIESFTTDTNTATLNFDWPDYDLDAENVRVAVRLEDDGGDADDEIEVYLNDVLLDEISIVNQSLAWVLLQIYTGTNKQIYADSGGSDFEAGETQTLEFISTGNTDGIFIDAVAIYDSSKGYDPFEWDNSVDSNYALSDPQLHPELVDVELERTSTNRDVSFAKVESSWIDDEVANEQYIELSNDGENFTRESNTDSIEVTFDEARSGVWANVGLSYRTVDGNNTPTVGDASQGIDLWELFANPDSVTPSGGLGITDTRSIIPTDTVDNVELVEGGQKSSDGTLLTRSVYGGVEMIGQQLISNERVRFGQQN